MSTQGKIDLCFGADDELMKKEAKDWGRGDGKEAIKEEKEDRIKRQGKREQRDEREGGEAEGTKRGGGGEESLTPFPKHEHLLYRSHLNQIKSLHFFASFILLSAAHRGLA